MKKCIVQHCSIKFHDQHQPVHECTNCLLEMVTTLLTCRFYYQVLHYVCSKKSTGLDII